MTKKFKYIIIGAGVSGLTSAYQLLQQGETDFIILEARDRIGGRVLTKNDIDLGPVWFQPSHKNLEQLLLNLGLKKFNQYSKGKSILVYNTMAPAHYFESNQSQPSAHRISNGTFALVKKLNAFISDKIELNTIVETIENTNNSLNIITNNGTYASQKTIITLPPKLATTLTYKPELPIELQEIMEKTHTWMSNAIKVGIKFKTPFWRDKDFSGTLIGQIGPVTELYDHTNAKETSFSLMGFINEALRDVTAGDRKERVLNYLEKYLGIEVRDHLSYEEKDWSQDNYTSCASLKSTYMSPQYGNPIFEGSFMDNKLLFSGTETSPYFGGYLEGAVISGILAAKKL